MTCQVHERDLTQVVVSKTADGLAVEEKDRSGVVKTHALTQEQWEAQAIPLSNSSIGMRTLLQTYSDISEEYGWFVESRLGFDYSISRAECD